LCCVVLVCFGWFLGPSLWLGLGFGLVVVNRSPPTQQEAERALANTQRQLMDLQRHERAPDASAAAAAAPAPVCAPPSEDMKAMVTMLHEAHGALVSTNKRLLQQLRSEQEARAAETAQLRKNFAELRRRYETVTSHYTGSSAPGAPG